MTVEEWRSSFPDDQCLKIVAELSVWTSVDHCLAAARWIEQRPQAEDQPSGRLVVPYPDDDGYEAVFVHCLDWWFAAWNRSPGVTCDCVRFP